MSEITNEELTLLEGNVVNIYIEKSITVNSPTPEIFSQTFKMGASVDVPESVGLERTQTWLKNHLHRELQNQYKQMSRGYKSQGIK